MIRKLPQSAGLALTAVTLALIITSALLAVPNRFDLSLLDFLIPVFSAACLGGLILYHRSTNLTGWLIAAFAFLFAMSEFSRQYALYGVLTMPGALPLARWVAGVAYLGWLPGLICLTVLLPLFFPTGRLLSPRWRGVVWLALVVILAHTLFTATLTGDYETPGIPNPLGNPTLQAALLAGPYLMLIYSIWVGITLLAILSLGLRYRRADRAVRKQIKWLVYAFGLLAVSTLAEVMLNVDFPPFFFAILLQAVWIILAISILWYHLFDIDLIIRRTLVYSLLTALLAVIYFSGVTFLQSLFVAFSGQQSPLSIVLSTLVIAALFNPLRRRIQNLIDRRFYRQKYNAEQALAQFAAAARRETDFAALTSQLLAVLTAALQPQTIKLWLPGKSPSVLPHAPAEPGALPE